MTSRSSNNIIPISHFSLAHHISPTGQRHTCTARSPPWPNENVPATTTVGPRPRTMATTERRRRAVSRRIRLRHRRTPRWRTHAAHAAALRRISRPLGLRDLPRKQGRLRGLRPTDRIHSRRARRRPRHRLWPLPGRPNRLDLTPDELTVETTKQNGSHKG